MVAQRTPSAVQRLLALVRGIRNHDHENPYMRPDFARTYERLVASTTHRVTGRQLLSEVADATASGDRVLEVGAGTGLDAISLARSRSELEVVGSEPHGPMLERARALPDQPSNLRWVQAPAGALPFEDGYFQAVYSANAIKHFPDARGAVAEMLRVLRPGGLLLVSEVSPWVPFSSSWRFTRLVPVPFFLAPVLAVRIRRSTADLLPARPEVEAWFHGHAGAEDFEGLDQTEHAEDGLGAFWLARLRRR